MFKTFSHQERSWGGRALRWRTTFLAIALALGLGSAAQTTPASARESLSITNIDYHIRVTTPQSGRGQASICTGLTYPIKVSVSEHLELLADDGEILDTIRNRPAPATVEGFVTNPGIGTLTPASLNTGPAIANDGPGEVEFAFHAKKAGQTNLNFRATVEDYGGSPDAIAPIQVEDCSYKVYMNVFGVNLGGDVRIWTAGRMETKISSENGKMTGSGTLKFMSGLGGLDCSASYSLYEIPTNIRGPGIENDQLKLNFNLGSGNIQASFTCPETSRSVSQTIDLTGLGMPEFTFPAEGGIDTYVTDYMDIHATFIITVVPER